MGDWLDKPATSHRSIPLMWRRPSKRPFWACMAEPTRVSRAIRLNRCKRRCKQQRAHHKSCSILIRRMASMQTTAPATARSKHRTGGNGYKNGSKKMEWREVRKCVYVGAYGHTPRQQNVSRMLALCGGGLYPFERPDSCRE